MRIFKLILFLCFLCPFVASAGVDPIIQRWNCLVEVHNSNIMIFAVNNKIMEKSARLFDEGNPDNEGIFQVTFDNMSYAPSFSPDGKAIAFISGKDMTGDICITNVDGTNLKHLDINWENGIAGNLFFTPNGKNIIFRKLDKEGCLSIFSINVDGTQEKQLTHKIHTSEPSISPDSRFISYSSNGLYIMDINGNDVKQVNSSIDIFDFDFSRDGKYIAYSTSAEGESYVYLFDISRGAVSKLLFTKGVEHFSFYNDGKILCDYPYDEKNEGGYYIMNINGSDCRKFDLLIPVGGFFSQAFAPMLINGKLLDYYGHWHEIGE